MSNQQQLQERIRQFDGVVGAVIVGDGEAIEEIEVFRESDIDEEALRTQIVDAVKEHGSDPAEINVVIYELSDEAVDSGGLPARPVFRLAEVEDVSDSGSRALISLVMGDKESEATGSGRRTEYSLRLVAATTIEAAQAFAGQGTIFTLEGVSLVEAIGQRTALVLVKNLVREGELVMGAALVRDGVVHDAVVRASLDAINRQLGVVIPPA